MSLRNLVPLAGTALVLWGIRGGVPAHAQNPLPAAANPEAAVVLIRTSNTLRTTRGSGFVVGDGSWVVTAGHVVSVALGRGRRLADRTAWVYSPWTGGPVEAQVEAVDGPADIAVLRLPRPGHPALPVEGLELKDAAAGRVAIQGRPLKLFGFPLTYGEATIAALARPESNESRLQEITQRGETNLCVLGFCKDVQPGWSGGPMVSTDRGAVVAVFHSLYRKAGQGDPVPAGSLSGYLGDLLRRAGAVDLAPFAQPPAPTLPAAEKGAARLALAIRTFTWAADGSWDKAEAEQRELLKLAPSDALSRVELGRILMEQKKFEDALRELTEAVRQEPKSITARLALGRAYHLNFEPKKAAAEFQTALTLSPREAEPHLMLADLYEANQQPDQAEAALRTAAEKHPDHPAILSRLGTLRLRGKTPDEGLKLLARAAELCSEDPALVPILLSYGRALENARKNREAEATYRQALRVDPDSPEARYYLAVHFYRQNRFDEAELELARGIQAKELSEPLLQAFRQLQLRINERGAKVGK